MSVRGEHVAMASEPQSIDDQDARRVILSGANESNFGLYQVIWELNGRYPGVPLSEKYRAATDAIRELFGRGWIRFYKEHWKRRGADQYEEFSPADLDALLENPASWYPWYDNVQIAIETTPAGEAVYMAGGEDAAERGGAS